MNTYRKGYNYLKDQLGSAFEAKELLEQIMGVEKDFLTHKGEALLEEAQWQALEQALSRRLQGEPLQYILGEWEFYSLPFYVGPGVLIPRPETELLVEGALQRLQHAPTPRVLDLCSGSGCVAISIEKNGTSRVVGVEKSPTAFDYFRKNIQRNESRVEGVLGDVLTYTPKHKQDVIVSNPPYIPQRDLQRLQLEVRREPELALDGGEEGLDFYRVLPQRYKKHLKPQGWLGVEIGIGQQESVTALFKEEGYKEIEVVQDYAGIPRVVWGQN